MTELIGVHFKNAGKVLFLDPGELKMHINDKVVAETSRGVEIGIVRTSRMNLDEKKVDPEGNKILRIATPEDIEKSREIQKEEEEAYKICKKKIKEHGLEMKLVEAQYTFDKKKLTFYFLADGRVDFRALVKDLASAFHTRIELRQIGVRDETKIVGGIGICGRELCCATFLNGFTPVSIKMAKEQNLSLNPSKISGVCGKLMCCLKNEEEAYEELNMRLPRRGDEVTTPDGKVGEVQSVDVLREKIRVIIEEGDSRVVNEFKAAELKYEPGVHKKAKHKKAAADTAAKTETPKNTNEDSQTRAKNTASEKKSKEGLSGNDRPSVKEKASVNRKGNSKKNHLKTNKPNHSKTHGKVYKKNQNFGDNKG
jgi:cell fate regulator YaaT (PSP1 superfamily)